MGAIITQGSLCRHATAVSGTPARAGRCTPRQSQDWFSTGHWRLVKPHLESRLRDSMGRAGSRAARALLHTVCLAGGI